MAEERAQRRLAAILAADVVGYSRLMQADEAGTLAALKTRRRDVLQPAIARHRGRIVKVMGDGVLVEFASAVDAVECAVALQEAMDAANDDMPEDRRIVLRIGINLGDVMVEGSDLYGDGVNIAARLEALADAGSVFISQTVFSHVKGKTNLDFEDLGERSLKNMAEPVRVYRLSGTRYSYNRHCDRQGQSAVETIDCGPALRQHERRSGAGVSSATALPRTSSPSCRDIANFLSLPETPHSSFGTKPWT